MRSDTLYSNSGSFGDKAGAILSDYRKEVLRQTVFTTAKTLTTDESGAIILMDKNEATTITLPAITGADIGLLYLIVDFNN